MSRNEIFTLVLPLVLPVVVGWALVQGHLAEPKDAKVLTTVFLWVCAPAELINTLAAEDLDELFDPRLVLGTVVGFAVVWPSAFTGLPVMLATGGSAAAVA